MSRVTRRQFLVGAGATSAVAVGGGGTYVATHSHSARRFLHRHGVLGGPDEPIPDVAAEYESAEFASPAMKRSVGYGIFIPRARVTAALLCLHGRGGTHRDPFDDIGLHKFVAARQLPWVVAAVDGGESFWHRRADGTDAMSLVVDELADLAHQKAPGVEQFAVIGWSMGGYGALLLAEQHAEKFAAAVASGPSVWHSLAEATAGSFDDADDFARNDVLGALGSLHGDRTRIDCGEDDPFADVTREMLRALPGASGGVHDGYHESPSWRSYVPAQLSFLKNRLPS